MKTIVLTILLGLFLLAPALAQNADQRGARQEEKPAMSETDRIPFLAENENPTNSAAAPSSGGLIVRAFGAMFLIVGLIFAGAWALKKFGFAAVKTEGNEDLPHLSVVSTVSLGANRTLSLVRFGEKILLVGSTPQIIAVLAEENGEKEFLASPRSVAELLADETDNAFAAHLDSAAEYLALKGTKGNLN